MSNFLLETGTEEIPARFLKDEANLLESLFKNALAENNIAYGNIETFITPRRAAVLIHNLAEKQAESEELITGPPAKAAYEQNGEPSKALSGFCKTNGIDIGSIFLLDTEKGRYAACRKKKGGAETAELMPEICKKVISAINFPKQMRWGDGSFAFARPIRWILALLDEKIVPFSIEDLSSGRKTWGHRIHSKNPQELQNAKDYPQFMEKNCSVVLKPQDRRKKVTTLGDELAKEKNGTVIWKDALLEEVEGLVEWPVPLLGAFDAGYLEIPDEVLLTSMETHQKCFGLRDSSGRLLPNFLAVANIVSERPEHVKTGWEKVLKARLEDARFFWKEDLKESNESRRQKLENVIFIGSLGTMAEKAGRLEALCAFLAEKLNLPEKKEAARAGKLAKTDLVSQMVGEFATLQGIMGGIYAEKSGESQNVANAIKEQYLPQGPDSPLPQTNLGLVLSIADKLDTLAGCFGLGMIPTGAADPNGLRRNALGIIRILLEHGWQLNTDELVLKALDLYGGRQLKLTAPQVLEKLKEFIETRLRVYLAAKGYPVTVIDAVLSAPYASIPEVEEKLKALQKVYNTPEFEKTCQVLKRVENIAKKQAEQEDKWDDALLKEKEDKDLANALKTLLPQIESTINNGNYVSALGLLEKLDAPVANFFDNVMVLCDDLALRKNRLAMLNAINSQFSRIAKFSQLQKG